MLLYKNGAAFEVSHPADIARFKRLGYVEQKPEPVKVEVPPVDAKAAKAAKEAEAKAAKEAEKAEKTVNDVT